MVKHKKIIRKQFMDKRLRISEKLYAIVILIMLGLVIYDSFKHTLPFYYVLYGFAGYIVGYAIWLNQKIILSNDNKSVSLSINHWGKAISILLLILRYFAGKIILEQYNVIWASDALYLIFIGVYFAKIKSIFRQIDEHLYAFFHKKLNSKHDILIH